MFKINQKISFVIILLFGTVLIVFDYDILNFFYHLIGPIDNKYFASLIGPIDNEYFVSLVISISGIIALFGGTFFYFIFSKKNISIWEGIILAFWFVIVKFLQMYIYAYLNNDLNKELTFPFIVVLSLVYAYWAILTLLIAIVLPNLIIKRYKAKKITKAA